MQDNNLLKQYKKAIEYLHNLGIASLNLEQYEMAIKYLQQALPLAQKIGDQEMQSSCLNNIGFVYRQLKQYKKAIEYLQSALPLAQKIGDQETEACCIYNLGIASLNLKQYEMAIKYLQQALPLAQKIGDQDTATYCLWTLGIASFNLKQTETYGLYNREIRNPNLKQYEKVILIHTSVIALAQAKEDRELEAFYLSSLADFYCNRLGKYEEAIKYWEQSVAIKREIQNKEGLVKSLQGLASAYSSLGNRSEEIKYLQEALDLAKKIGYRRGEVFSLNNLGVTYQYSALNEEAEKYFQQTLLLAQKIEDKKGEIAALNNLAAFFVGDLNEQLNYFMQALALAQEIGDKRAESKTLDLLVDHSFFIKYEYLYGENNKAIEYLHRSLAISREINDIKSEAQTLNTLGNLLSSQRKTSDQAIEYLEKSLAISRKIKHKRCQVWNMQSLAKIYSTFIPNIPKTIQILQDILNIATPTTMPKECRQAGSDLGDLGFGYGNWKIAIQGYARAIEASEQIYAWRSNDESRQEIISLSQHQYGQIVQCYVNLQQYDKALEYAERSRSKLLVDLMESTELSGGEISPDLEQLSQDYDELQQRINAIRSRDQSNDNQEIEILEAQKQEKWQQIRKLDPVLAGQIQVNPLNFEEIQGLVNNSTTAILSFYILWEDTHIFILRQSQTTQLHTCHEQGSDTLQKWLKDNWLTPYLEYKNEKNRQIKLIKYSKWINKMEETLQELSQRLQINELIEKYLTDIEELIIVPDFALHQIPFAALPLGNTSPINNSLPINSQSDNSLTSTRIAYTPEDTSSSNISKTPFSTSTSTTEYLGQRFRLCILPSLQILNYCHQRPPIREKLMGIVEDATSDLYFTNFECENLAKLYHVTPDNHLKQQTATTANYYQLVKKQGINLLHSSHHAGFDESKPLESKLLLADGFFTLGQIIAPGWRMPNLDHVFLSCCETHLSTLSSSLTDSNNILTIGTGFLCAGARSVVATLWTVDDLATSLFTIFYYQECEQCSSRSQALQNAQLRLRTLTREEFENNYKYQIREVLKRRLNQSTNSDEKNLIESKISYLNFISKDPDHFFPFNHPVYWAGFIYQGLIE